MASGNCIKVLSMLVIIYNYILKCIKACAGNGIISIDLPFGNNNNRNNISNNNSKLLLMDANRF